MKTMKRQTRTSTEVDHDINERKKQKLMPVSTELPKQFLETSVEGTNGETHDTEETHDIVVTDRNVAKLLEPKTSTPITHNGSFNIAEKFNNTSAIPDAISFPSPTGMFTTEDATLKNADVCNGAEPVDAEDESQNSARMHNVCDEAAVDTVEEQPAMPEKIVEEMEVVINEEIRVVEEEKRVVEEGRRAVKNGNPRRPQLNADLFMSLLQVTELEGHAEDVFSVALDDNVIISASEDTTVKLWDSEEKMETRNFQGHTGSVNAVILLTEKQSAAVAKKMKFTGVKRIIVSGSTDCSIRFWSMLEGTELKSIYSYNGIKCLAYMENQGFIVVGTDGGKLELWDLATQKATHSVVAHEGSVAGVKVDGDYIYTTSSDGKVTIWLLDEDELYSIYTRTRMVPGQGAEMQPADWKCLDFHDNVVYLGDNTSDLKIINWKKGSMNMRRNQIQTNGVIDAICIEQNILLSSTYDSSTDSGAINAWQLPAMTYICTLSGEIGRVKSLAMTYTDEGNIHIISGGSKLLMWEFISSLPPIDRAEDKYFCREIETIGEDTSIKGIDVTDASRKHDDSHPCGWKSKCTFI